jgi:RHS repeat-associated protein
MFVNGLFSGARTSTDNFTAYINPYLVVSKGGNYTKHIYIGSQRIVSKLGDLDSYGQDPRRIAYAGSEVDGANVDFAGKYREAQQTVKDRYTDFGVEYRGEDNDDYVNGGGFCCDDSPSLRSGAMGNGNDNPELYQYYYHSDHLGSTSLITNLDGEIVQHVEYVPFGEVFIEERNNTWNTPYLFNAKELDEETGLYYYGARYYDSRVSVWLGVDPIWERYPGISPYAYCANDPVNAYDLHGDSIWYTKDDNIVTMHVTGKVINKSGDNINMNRAAKDIASDIDKTFSGEFEMDKIKYTLKTDVQLEAVSSMNDVTDSDHLFVLADADGKSARGATNMMGGKVMTIAASDYANNNWFSNTFSWNNTRTAVHEFGHAAGLAHVSGLLNTFNLMKQNGSGESITSSQRTDMIYKWNKINRGSNSYRGKPYPFVHDPKTGTVYRASDLLNWNRRYGR